MSDIRIWECYVLLYMKVIFLRSFNLSVSENDAIAIYEIKITEQNPEWKGKEQGACWTKYQEN